MLSAAVLGSLIVSVDITVSVFTTSRVTSKALVITFCHSVVVNLYVDSRESRQHYALFRALTTSSAATQGVWDVCRADATRFARAVLHPPL